MDLTRQEIARRLEERDGFLILTHKRPDGDTLGCAVALCHTLRALGKTAWVQPNEDATPLFEPYMEGVLAPEGFVPETVVSTDIASEGLFTGSEEGWKGKVDLCIDHHPSNERFAKYNCVEADKAACGEIVYAIARDLLKTDRLPAEIALPLYVAVSTDTGCFVYSNTSPNTHRVAAELMETGIDAAWVNKRHFRTKSRKRLEMEARMVETMEFHDGGAIALATVTLADMARIGATEADVEDISSFTGQLEGVQTAVTIKETADGACKLSVRTGPELNASKVCALLGGGGHAAASGCTVPGDAAAAKKAIMGAIRQVQQNA